MKNCPRCSMTKPLTEFNRKFDGLQPTCRDCNRTYLREHYRNNKQYYVVKAANLKARLCAILDGYLSEHPCVDCGERDIIVLDFDHVRGQKIRSVTDMARLGVSLDTMMAEIDKCEIRCANCHRRATHARRQSTKAS